MIEIGFGIARIEAIQNYIFCDQPMANYSINFPFHYYDKRHKKYN